MANLARTTLFCAAALALILAGVGARALDTLEFRVAGGDGRLEKAMRAASGLLAAERDKRTAALDLIAEARAEYGRLLAALYARGHFGPVIHVLIDGREAAAIAPLDAPGRIGRITVTIDPGPLFAFSRATIAPLAPRTELPPGFAVGRVAGSDVIKEAAQAGVDGWRTLGHAKATVGEQHLVADHRNATLSAALEMSPGPVLRFGTLTINGTDRLRPDRALAIAGLPQGRRFDPKEAARVADRLRRSGIFTSVTLTEDAQVSPPDLLGMTADVTEAKPRRYTFGAEVASYDGVVLSGSWLHRNLWRGGERLEISGEIAGIAAQGSGVDYRLGVTLDRPATPGPDTVLTLGLQLGQTNDVDASAHTVDLSAGFTHYFGDTLQGRAALAFAATKGRDAAGPYAYRSAELPIGLTWDRRNSATDPTGHVYLDLGVKPFFGFGATDNGARLTFDLRGYKALGAAGGVVLAGRLQGGAVLGADILATPRDDLFLSGGGGTVRGMPYRSLGVTVDDGGTPVTLGGNRFVAASVEARVKLGEKLGLVGFVDMGLVGNGGDSDWQAGAGVGVRYATGVGPVRLDVALPVHGAGNGVQLYVGLGQAF